MTAFNRILKEIFGKIFALVLVCLFLTVASGCSKEEGQGAPQPLFEIGKEYKRGPVVFTLKVSREKITIADRLQLFIEVSAQEEYEVRLPEFGEKLEQFGIVDYHASSPRLTDNGLVELKKYYELEPFLSGEYTVPPMKISFWKKGSQEKKHVIESEPITVEVKSLLPEKSADLEIKEIMGPVELPRPAMGLVYGLIGAGILGVGGVAGYFIWRRRQITTEKQCRRPAHEIAYEELGKLLAADLVEKGQIKHFYLHLSRILRHYIENRFGLHAPERTTEEFLADLRTTEALAANHKNLLKDFLQHCDMVKFAKHQPTNKEIQKTFDVCKEFISETETREGVGPTD